MADETSITSLKSSFIRAQVRLLSTPLEPSTQWRDLVPTPEEGPLSDKAIQDIVTKVNDKIKQHNRMIYPVQSQRHVAEQIETLHWNMVSSSDSADLGGEAVVVHENVELTTTDAVETLPHDYDDLHLHPDHQHSVEEAEEYGRLRQRLSELSHRRDALKRKRAVYQRLRTLLEPLDDPRTQIQPNLVTRDGELSQELDRTRVLLARVTAGAARARSNGTGTPAHPTPLTGLSDQQRLARVMGLT